jgi:hypothetical protein
MTTIPWWAASIVAGPAGWAGNWAWGLPLIVLTVIVHVLGLVFVQENVVRPLEGSIQRHRYNAMFVTVLAAATLSIIVLHGLEATIWCVAYRLLHAIPDNRSALLYSLNAITSYGHTNLELESHWHLMGALEALNGWLLFGLSTAFLFTVIQQFGSLERGKAARSAFKMGSNN